MIVGIPARYASSATAVIGSGLADQVSYLLYLCLVIVLRVLYNNFHVIIVGGFDTHIVNHGLPPSIVQHTLGEADNVLLLFPRACAATQDDQG